jgi:hypothetical protein
MLAMTPLSACAASHTPHAHRRRRACSTAARASAGAFKVLRAPAEDARLRAAAAFHLAIPVADLAASRRFYGGVLGLPEGRSAPRWIDFNCYGHQLVCHLVDGYSAFTSRNAVSTPFAS